MSTITGNRAFYAAKNVYKRLFEAPETQRQSKCECWQHYSPSVGPLVGVKFREEASQL